MEKHKKGHIQGEKEVSALFEVVDGVYVKLQGKAATGFQTKWWWPDLKEQKNFMNTERRQLPRNIT